MNEVILTEGSTVISTITAMPSTGSPLAPKKVEVKGYRTTPGMAREAIAEAEIFTGMDAFNTRADRPRIRPYSNGCF